MSKNYRLKPHELRAQRVGSSSSTPIMYREISLQHGIDMGNSMGGTSERHERVDSEASNAGGSSPLPMNVLGAQKRTETNENELRRKGCCYPLRFEQKHAFKPHARSGQSGFWCINGRAL